MSKTTNLTNIQKVCQEFNNDPLLISKELKKIQSIKCRLKKQKAKSTYNIEMTTILQQEQLLKEAKSTLIPKSTPVTQFTISDISLLDFEQTTKAIRSIQSKKTLTKYLTEDPNSNDEYQAALKIESLLISHKNQLLPTQQKLVHYDDIQTVINTIQDSNLTDINYILEMLQNLIK